MSSHLTIVKLTVTLTHPLWEGDGKDEEIAVNYLKDMLAGLLRGGDTYSIDDVDTDE